MAGKKLKAAYESFDREAVFALEDAVGMVKKNATAKFDETIEICMNLGIDTRCRASSRHR
jgi:large subunit ribosomal protein L1